MANKSACLIAVWALVIAPGLCRFGTLQACCVPVAPEQHAEAADDCCKKNREPKPAKPAPRDCGSCAHLCDAAVKAPGDEQRFDLAEALLLPELPQVIPACFGCAFIPLLPFDCDIGLRFPFSDIPLLI